MLCRLVTLYVWYVAYTNTLPLILLQQRTIMHTYHREAENITVTLK